jgi:single-strand DNA-binding protein
MPNVISFIGTLGRDAEVKQTPSGMSVLSANVANNIGYGDKKTTQWFRVALFGKRAEGALPGYLKKGQQVHVIGEFHAREWEDKDGAKRIALEVTASEIELVGGKKEGGQTPPSQREPGADDNFDDDIPF